MFIAVKTEDGELKGKISFYCRVLHVSRQAFRNYLKNKDAVWKYQLLADAMMDICMEDECNDTYGRIRMYQALQLKQPEGVHIPSERTVYRVMDEIGISHRPKRKPNGITFLVLSVFKLSLTMTRNNLSSSQPSFFYGPAENRRNYQQSFQKYYQEYNFLLSFQTAFLL